MIAAYVEKLNKCKGVNMFNNLKVSTRLYFLVGLMSALLS
jgi:hypothetical protein